MTIITMTDLKRDLKKYTEMATKDDVIITKNGKSLVKLVNASRTNMDILNELAGSIVMDKSYEDYMDERYSKI